MVSEKLGQDSKPSSGKIPWCQIKFVPSAVAQLKEQETCFLRALTISPLPLISSTETVKDMILNKRKCLKHDEDLGVVGIKLEAFQNYSRPSCLLECRSKKLFELCNCLPYYIPDFSKVWNKPVVCNQTGLQCLANITGKTL